MHGIAETPRTIRTIGAAIVDLFPDDKLDTFIRSAQAPSQTTELTGGEGKT